MKDAYFHIQIARSATRTSIGKTPDASSSNPKNGRSAGAISQPLLPRILA